MGNKSLYYKYKQEGRCTKCGGVLGNSPSTVRCLPCNEKFLEKQRSQPQTISKPRQESPGDSHQIVEEVKNNPLDATHATVCICCGSPINTFGRLCQTCLADREFKLAEAVSRYDPRCCQCQEEILQLLMLVSANPDEPMEMHGPPLFKKIMHAPKLPNGYRVMCMLCYRTLAIEMSKSKRKTFERNNIQKKEARYSDNVVTNLDEEIEVEDES